MDPATNWTLSEVLKHKNIQTIILRNYPYFFLPLICLFIYLKGTATQQDKKKQRQRDVPYFNTQGWPDQSQELHQGLPFWVQRSKNLSHPAAFQCALAGTWIRTGAAKTLTDASMACQHCRQWLNALCHMLGPKYISLNMLEIYFGKKILGQVFGLAA